MCIFVDVQIPGSFFDHVAACDGFDEHEFRAAHAEAPQVSVRLHHRKPACSFALTDPVPWMDNAYYLPEKPYFAHDPFFHAGCYYVQEAGSMFLGFLLEKITADNKAITALDLCASPGGKSTLLRSMLPEHSLLISNEAIRNRTSALIENVMKWGEPGVMITHNDVAHFAQLHACFDLVVVDAPCSGSGMFRKDEKAVAQWSEELVDTCAIRQRNICNNICNAIKEGGYLIYSTCSYSREENEDIIASLVGSGIFKLIHWALPAEWNIVQNKYGYRFYPGKTRSEGFFISVLQKVGSTGMMRSPGSIQWEEAPSAVADAMRSFFLNDGSLKLLLHKDLVLGFPEMCLPAALPIISHLHALRIGLPLATLKGRDIIPEHPLAMSAYLHPELPVHKVDLPDALNYLRRGTIASELPAGWFQVTYQERTLGWAKQLGNRINNYYPTEWRLRK
ncbi:MAG: hypothetical protein R2794_13360 [Chitinophagales bacterium]